MLQLLSTRFAHGKDSTLSLCINGDTGQFYCFFCEDQYQKIKVAKETRIPAGRYEIKLRNVGGMTKDYSDNWPERGYPQIHKGMLHLQDVPGFDWIYIHVGNNDDHTEGCLLAGYNGNYLPEDGGGEVGRSVDAYIALYKVIVAEMDKGERVFLTIKDN